MLNHNIAARPARAVAKQCNANKPSSQQFFDEVCDYTVGETENSTKAYPRAIGQIYMQYLQHCWESGSIYEPPRNADFK